MARTSKSAGHPAPVVVSQPVQDEAPKRKRGAQPGNKNRIKARVSKIDLAVDQSDTPVAAAGAPAVVGDAPKRKRGGQPGNGNSKGHGKGRPRIHPLPDPNVPPNPRGRPEVMTLDADTLKRISLLAKVRSTLEEAAAHFDVATSTFHNFLNHNKSAMDMWTKGAAQFNTSLRSKMIELANAGNPTMLIWLSKQFLGMKDKHEHSGDAASPIRHEHKIAQTPKEAADAYAELIRGVAV